MPDYDVQALALAVPPASAPVATYYPAVSVRNNGIHPAPVTGTLRIHDKAAGTLVATLALLSTSNLNPGATASVPATTAWSPTTSDIGKQFLFSAEVKSPLDEVPGNNQLSPVTVLVTAEPPAPPPVTVRHAAQHEHDGADEIDVSGLPGVLASGQYPKPHKYTHGIDGDDMLNVDGLPGELHDSQPALAHGNERHTAAYTTEGALTAHNNSQAAHANSANLEHTAAKGAASGYAALDASTRVPKDQLGTGQGTTGEFLRGDRTWATPPVSQGSTLVKSGAPFSLPPNEQTLISFNIPAAQFVPGSAIQVRVSGLMSVQPFKGGDPIIYVRDLDTADLIAQGVMTVDLNSSGAFWLDLVIYAYEFMLVRYFGASGVAHYSANILAPRTFGINPSSPAIGPLDHEIGVTMFVFAGIGVDIFHASMTLIGY
jgi:hypothetical protein